MGRIIQTVGGFGELYSKEADVELKMYRTAKKEF